MSWTIEEFADVWGLLPTHRALQALWRYETIALPEKARLEAELAVLSARYERLRKAAAWVLNPGPGLDALKAGAELAAALAEDGNG